MNLEIMAIAGVGVAVLVVILGVILLCKSRKKKPAVQDDIDALEIAYRNNLKMDVRLVEKGINHRFVSGLCTGLSTDSVTIDINIVKDEQSLVGRVVHVFFQIKDDTGKVRNYDFQAPIIRLVRCGDHFALEVARLKNLGNSQKRNYVRLAPQEGLFSDAAFWYYQDEKLFPKILTDMQKMVCLGEVTIRDISGGGIRIALKTQAPEDTEFKTGAFGVFHIVTADDPDEKEPVNIWLLADLVFIPVKESGAMQELAFKFRKWAKVPGKDLMLTWLPPEFADGGIPPLVSWILRKQHMNTRFLV